MTGLDVKLSAGGKGGVKDRLLAGWLDRWTKVPLMGVRTGEGPGFWGREFMSLDVDMFSCDDAEAPYMMQSWGP